MPVNSSPRVLICAPGWAVTHTVSLPRSSRAETKRQQVCSSCTPLIRATTGPSSSQTRRMIGKGPEGLDAHRHSCKHVALQLQGLSGPEASKCSGGSGPPSQAPTSCCPPACSHLCTTMSGIFLSAQLGGGAWGHEQACTWASARGKPAKQPPHRLLGRKGRTQGWARPPKSLGGVGSREPDSGTEPTRLGIGRNAILVLETKPSKHKALGSVPSSA